MSNNHLASAGKKALYMTTNRDYGSPWALDGVRP